MIEFFALAFNRSLLSAVTIIFVVLGNSHCQTKSIEYQLYQGKRLDEKVIRTYLQDSMWVDSVFLASDKRFSYCDTFEVDNGIWYQHFHGVRSVFFSKEYFNLGKATCRYAHLDSSIYLGFNHYELVPDSQIDTLVSGHQLYAFYVYANSNGFRKCIENIYFDPQIGIVRHFVLFGHDVRLRQFIVNQKTTIEYQWKSENLPIDILGRRKSD